MRVGFASISRLKLPYKPTVQGVCATVIVGKRFAVSPGAKHICIVLARHRHYRQGLTLRSRYHRKTKNRLPQKITAVLHYGQTTTAVLHYRRKIPSYFGLQLPPKSLPPRNEKPPTAKKYRRIALPPNKYRYSLVCRLRQSRFRQKRENRQPLIYFQCMEIPPRMCPPPKTIPTITLNLLL